MAATATIKSTSQLVGGPKLVIGYITADATTTQETVDLSAYGKIINHVFTSVHDNIATGGIEVKATTYSSTTTLTIDHTSPTTTSAKITFIALME